MVHNIKLEQIMSEIQPQAASTSQTHPGASFFKGREGLLLPKSGIELPNTDLPVQPVTDLFDVVRDIWEANGHQTGRVSRYDTIELPECGYNTHALLFSRYFGKTDEELAAIDTPFDKTGTKLRLLQSAETVQGTEEFAISIPSEIRRTGKTPLLSSGRVSLLLSRTYHFQAVPITNLHRVSPGKQQGVEIIPDQTQDTTHVFIGTKRLEELDEAQPHLNEYTARIAHYLVSELLSDHAK
jgi:hypothetical protein